MASPRSIELSIPEGGGSTVTGTEEGRAPRSGRRAGDVLHVLDVTGTLLIIAITIALDAEARGRA